MSFQQSYKTLDTHTSSSGHFSSGTTVTPFLTSSPTPDFVPSDFLPLQHSSFIVDEQDRQTQPLPSKIVVSFITCEDILSGRGVALMHPGNVFFRQIVKQKQLEYIDGRRHEKQSIVDWILHTIRSRGGRFCKQYGKAHWEVIDDDTARRKTSQALREGAPELRRNRRYNSDVLS